MPEITVEDCHIIEAVFRDRAEAFGHTDMRYATNLAFAEKYSALAGH